LEQIGFDFWTHVISKIRLGVHCTRLGRVISSRRTSLNLKDNITIQKSFKNFKKKLGLPNSSFPDLGLKSQEQNYEPSEGK